MSARAAPRGDPPTAGRDAELVRRCLDGDEGAWGELVDAYGPLVWAVARKAGLSEADAADVHQTVWSIAVQDLHRVRRADRVGSWLANTAHYQSLRIVRGYRLHRRALGRHARTEPTALPPDVELVALERRHLVRDALARLGERCRRLLEFLYYEVPRPSYRAIGRRLGMRIGSIGPTRARCLERLEAGLGSVDDET